MSDAAADLRTELVQGGQLSDGARMVARGLRRPSLAPEAIGAVALLLDGMALTLAFWFAAFALQHLAFDRL